MELEGFTHEFGDSVYQLACVRSIVVKMNQVKDLPPNNYLVDHATPQTSDCGAELDVVDIQRVIVE